MKKSLLGLLLAFGLFTACKETETTTIDITGTATITGTVKADVEQTSSAFTSEPLSDYSVTIYWNTEDLGVVSDNDGVVQSVTVVTDANGVYTAEVPSTTVGVDYTVEFDDFTTNAFTFNQGTETITTTATFDGASFNVFALSGETKTRSYDFGSFPSMTEAPKLATIKGNVTAEIDETSSSTDPEPAPNAVVRITWNDGEDRTATTTTDTNGDYSIDLPTTDSGVTYTISFDEYEVDNYSDDSGTGLTARYDESGTFSSGSLGAGETFTLDYNHGSPDDVE